MSRQFDTFASRSGRFNNFSPQVWCGKRDALSTVRQGLQLPGSVEDALRNLSARFNDAPTLSETPRLVSVRAINVSVRQSRDRFLRHLHEPLGDHLLGALEAETIDDCVGVGPSQRNLRHKFAPRRAPPPHFQITFYL